MAGADVKGVLVIGGGGLVGSSITAWTGGTRLTETPWGDHDSARRHLFESVRAWVQLHPTWTIVWCAGTSVVSSDAQQLALEGDLLRSALVGAAMPVLPDGATTGRFVFVSSAGGIHAGCEGVVDERGEERPMSEYGFAKQRQEWAVTEWSLLSGMPSLIVRPSNVYGPGQNPAKSQGLISKVLTCIRDSTPLGLTVPMSTTRDYIYVSDVGRIVATLVSQPPTEMVATRLVAYGESHSIADVLNMAHDVTGGRCEVRLDNLHLNQPHHLAFAPSPSTLACMTDLRAGISRLWASMRKDRP